ncbi:MAG TPA: hypothetical protein VGD76_14400 [Ramlibacter sp.]
MSIELTIFAALVALAYGAWLLVRAALRKRRLRRALAPDAERAIAQLYLPRERSQSMDREHAASISADARAAALRVARGGEASNPHPARTREFVLWEATFHSAMSDFAPLPEEEKRALEGR